MTSADVVELLTGSRVDTAPFPGDDVVDSEITMRCRCDNPIRVSVQAVAERYGAHVHLTVLRTELAAHRSCLGGEHDPVADEQVAKALIGYETRG